MKDAWKASTDEPGERPDVPVTPADRGRRGGSPGTGSPPIAGNSVPSGSETGAGDRPVGLGGVADRGRFAAGGGLLVAAAFYTFVAFAGLPPLHRYFLGHPVAVVATTLFWVAVGILVHKQRTVRGQWARFRRIRDEDLLPGETATSPGERWRQRHDAGYAARRWLGTLDQLPGATRGSLLVRRLRELLTRQTHRGTTKHLADDLRELAARDADAAHDSLGLVRIIVWAIPMLGFLGTVIGITQTLGGLDFSDGTAAVDRLKSGLYVAFDTTALGLVLSVAAIFLQFPIERSEQRLLAALDGRVGYLLSANLPSDEAADNQTALVADLCSGIRAAVAESLAGQAELWRDTIDEANRHWRQAQQSGAEEFTRAVATSLGPALRDHADGLQESLRRAGDRTESQVERLVENLHHALRDHSGAIDESARFAGDRFETQADRWREVLDDSAETLLAHHQQLAVRSADLAEANHEAGALRDLQESLRANLEQLRESNRNLAAVSESSAGSVFADAMVILARAVDTLSRQLPPPRESQDGIEGRARRAA